jgi:hypothetical protein
MELNLGILMENFIEKMVLPKNLLMELNIGILMINAIGKMVLL